MLLVDAAMPSLFNSEAAAIVAISSVSGREIDCAADPYGTMKTAVIHYTNGLACQLAGKGIRGGGKLYHRNQSSVRRRVDEGRAVLAPRCAARRSTPRAACGSDQRVIHT